MFDKTFYGFEPEKFADMFKTADMTRFFEQARLPGFDIEAMMAAQKKNMDALVEANKIAAAGYQDLYKKQVAMFESAMADAQTQLSELKMDQFAPESASRQAEALKAAFDKALADMNELVELARKTNTDAFEVVKTRVEESVDELKALMPKDETAPKARTKA